jgi:tRNA-modifying protein YgfZ
MTTNSALSGAETAATAATAPAVAKVLNVGFDSIAMNQLAQLLGANLTQSSRGPQFQWLPAQGSASRPNLLAELGVLEFSGADATAFLQGQLTNDVALLSDNDIQLTGFCTAKGRLLASGWLWRRSNQQYYFLVQRALAAGLTKRLSLFVLRAKLSVRDQSPIWSVGGLLSSMTAIPAGEETLMSNRFEFGQQRRFVLTAQPELTQWQSSETWFLADCLAGLALVVPATSELFVPQMLNFDLRAGVSFKKGCYPGQEIVARSHYLGKAKRRLFLAHWVGSQAPEIGTDVISVTASGDTQPVGQLVQYALHPVDDVIESTAMRFAVLIECQIAAVQVSLDGGKLLLGSTPLVVSATNRVPNDDLIPATG